MMMKSIFILVTLIVSVLILSSFGGGGNTDYPGGSPGGYTGSPGDGGKTCKNCHGGTVANVTGWITSNIPAQGYTPGTSYTITVTVTGSGSKGFEVSPQNTSGGLLGTLTPGAGTELCNGNKAVTQSSGSSSNPKTWNFTWTAPAAGTGDVTFYGAFTVSKPNTKLCTLVVSEYIPPAPLTVIATASPESVCAGSSSQLSATASGGGGSYTYTWSSIPSGYSSNIQNPVVQPVVNTQYIVAVSDGTESVSDTVEVNVTQSPTSFTGNDTTCNVNVAEIQLHGQASNYSSLLWSASGDGSFSDTGILNPIYFPGSGDRTTGWVNLYLTASPNAPCTGNASSGMTVTFSPNVGLDGHQTGELQVSVSPNPTHGKIHVTCSGQPSKLVVANVFDVRGYIVSSNVVPLDATCSGEIDISGYPKGVYFIGIRTNLQTSTHKVLLF